MKSIETSSRRRRAIAVGCPTCGAHANKSCLRPDGKPRVAMHADRYGLAEGKRPARPVKLGGARLLDSAHAAGVRFMVELNWGMGNVLAFLEPGEVLPFAESPADWWSKHLGISRLDFDAWQRSREDPDHELVSVVRCGQPTKSGKPCRRIVAYGLGPVEFAHFDGAACEQHGGG